MDYPCIYPPRRRADLGCQEPTERSPPAEVHVECFSPCLTGNRLPNAPPGALSALGLTPLAEEVGQSMTAARQTMAVIINFRKYNKPTRASTRPFSVK